MKILYVTEHIDFSSPSSMRKRYYVITKAVNTVRHPIAEQLTWARVQDYCSSPDWKIIITNKGV